ncbi:MAG TPA: tripartite tricarboxylate transporter TctB family protein [Burkholderiaceae bacterium]|nr:tripartite tricarboxylate transporter TctB family protein [Burkholderiaceae bacterium]
MSGPTPLRTVDRRVGVAIAALAVAVLWTSRSFPNVPGQKLGASTLPGFVGAALLACGLLLVLRSRPGRHYGEDEPRDAERIAPAFGIVAAIVLYLLASDPLGYPVAAPLALMVAFASLRVSPPKAAAWAIGASIAVHVAFYKLLKVPLPWGPLPPLY